MHLARTRLLIPFALAALRLAQPLAAQTPLTWAQLRDRFEASNPALKADALGVDEQRATEITAFLRPNPQLSLNADGTQIASQHGIWQPLSGTDFQSSFSYLHERDRKRELRQQSAKEGTAIAASQHEDLKRTLEFNLRLAFIAVLESKEVLRLAKDDLVYYDKIIAISRDRYRAGDIALIDLDRIELLRAEYLTEMQTALLNLRTAKIQLLQLLNDRTPVESLDVAGAFDVGAAPASLEEMRQQALDARPDLRAAIEAIEQSETNHKLAIANGSTDPTFSTWYTWNASNNNPQATQTLGLGVSVPLRIFDRNQGEKQRTGIDIERSRQAAEAARAQVFSDVDSADAQLESSFALVQPYKEQFNEQALRVRDTVTYSYQQGGASLTDFLNAQSDYRAIQLAYAQLIASYLTAASQLNLAVGREVLP